MGVQGDVLGNLNDSKKKLDEKVETLIANLVQQGISQIAIEKALKDLVDFQYDMLVKAVKELLEFDAGTGPGIVISGE